MNPKINKSWGMTFPWAIIAPLFVIVNALTGLELDPYPILGMLGVTGGIGAWNANKKRQIKQASTTTMQEPTVQTSTMQTPTMPTVQAPAENSPYKTKPMPSDDPQACQTAWWMQSNIRSDNNKIVAIPPLHTTRACIQLKLPLHSGITEQIDLKLEVGSHDRTRIEYKIQIWERQLFVIPEIPKSAKGKECRLYINIRIFGDALAKMRKMYPERYQGAGNVDEDRLSFDIIMQL